MKIFYNRVFRLFFLFVVAGVVILLDLLLKNYVEAVVPVSGNVPLIKGVIHLTFVTNSGAAFGIFSGARWVFVVLGVIVMAGIVFLVLKPWYISPRPALVTVSLSIIFGGAAGNWHERLSGGAVRDMFELEFMRFGIFNVADAALCAGVALLLLSALTAKRRGNDGERNNP